MRKQLLTIAGAACLTLAAHAQCGTGTGVDGAYSATSNVTLAGGTYNYTSFNINAGVTVTVTGNQPLIIYCTGAATINGSLLADGANGTNGVTFSSAGTGGAGVAGGGNGGNGIFSASLGQLPGSPGTGSGGGGQGQAWSGGGGAGYSAAGASTGNSTGGFGGPAYGTVQITANDAGSGGGGGSGGYNCGSGGGGGGGGYIAIHAASITIGASGTISARGGNGGTDGTGSCGGGGGGSGGSIWLDAATMTHNGTITATGGTGGASNASQSPYYGIGGAGAAGRIRLDYNGVLSGSGTSTPAVGYHTTASAGVQTAAVVTSNVSCFGGSDGSALATIMGGSGPFVSSWAPSGGNTTVATGLTAGTYTFTTTDANGCSGSSTVTITQATQITVTVTATDATCFGNCDGTATATASGGNPPYTYAWAPGGQTTPTVTGLCAGCYTVTVTDANGCSGTQTVCITSPSQIQLVTTAMNATCFGSCDGSAAVNATGGMPPYTYLWSPGGQTTPSVTGLCAGCYTITVTDANGCAASTVVCVTQPPQLQVVVTGINTSCFGSCDGAATVSVTGGTPPYTYLWTPGGMTTPTVTGLCAGCYTVAVTDAAGCVATQTVCITSPPALQLVTTVMNVSCFGSCDGAAAVSVTGGTAPYTYIWMPGAMTTPSVNGLCAGCYTLTVTDAAGCVATTSLCITEPPPPASGFLGNDTILCDSASLMACVPASNATYMWSTGATTQCINITVTGCYEVIVTDINGCTASDTICVTVTPCLGIDEQTNNGVSVYPNPASNSIRIVHGMSSPQPVQIMDMRGSVVLAETVSDNEEIDLSGLADGVYTIRVNGMQQRLVITR